MIVLENSDLIVHIAARGAEVQRLFGKPTQMEYLWNGRPEVWPRFSPLLFPIVGRLAQDTYTHGGQRWSLPAHGFARDAEFEVLNLTDFSATLVLKDSGEFRRKFPFAFRLSVEYTLEGPALKTLWTVTNPGTEKLLFSIGAHPGFSTRLKPSDHFEDYQIEFSRPENLLAREWDTKELLLRPTQKSYGTEATSFPLRHEHYDEALALIFPDIQSPVTLKSRVHGHGVRYDFEGFLWFTLWSPPGKKADFLCLEPWCGIPDFLTGPTELSQKQGIVVLGAGETFQAQQGWTVM